MNKLFVNSNELMIEQVQEGVTPQLFTRTTKETGSTEQEASTKASKHIPAKSELRELVINKIESDNDVTYEAHYLVDPDSIAATKLVESDSITNARQDALSYIPVNHVSTEYVDLSVPEEVQGRTKLVKSTVSLEEAQKMAKDLVPVDAVLGSWVGIMNTPASESGDANYSGYYNYTIPQSYAGYHKFDAKLRTDEVTGLLEEAKQKAQELIPQDYIKGNFKTTSEVGGNLRTTNIAISYQSFQDAFKKAKDKIKDTLISSGFITSDVDIRFNFNSNLEDELLIYGKDQEILNRDEFKVEVENLFKAYSIIPSTRSHKARTDRFISNISISDAQNQAKVQLPSSETYRDLKWITTINQPEQTLRTEIVSDGLSEENAMAKGLKKIPSNAISKKWVLDESSNITVNHTRSLILDDLDKVKSELTNEIPSTAYNIKFVQTKDVPEILESTKTVISNLSIEEVKHESYKSVPTTAKNITFKILKNTPSIKTSTSEVTSLISLKDAMSQAKKLIPFGASIGSWVTTSNKPEEVVTTQHKTEERNVSVKFNKNFTGSQTIEGVPETASNIKWVTISHTFNEDQNIWLDAGGQAVTTTNIYITGYYTYDIVEVQPAKYSGYYNYTSLGTFSGYYTYTLPAQKGGYYEYYMPVKISGHYEYTLPAQRGGYYEYTLNDEYAVQITYKEPLKVTGYYEYFLAPSETQDYKLRYEVREVPVLKDIVRPKIARGQVAKTYTIYPTEGSTNYSGSVQFHTLKFYLDTEKNQVLTQSKVTSIDDKSIRLSLTYNDKEYEAIISFTGELQDSTYKLTSIFASSKGILLKNLNTAWDKKVGSLSIKTSAPIKAITWNNGVNGASKWDLYVNGYLNNTVNHGSTATGVRTTLVL